MKITLFYPHKRYETQVKAGEWKSALTGWGVVAQGRTGPVLEHLPVTCRITPTFYDGDNGRATDDLKQFVTALTRELGPRAMTTIGTHLIEQAALERARVEETLNLEETT